MSDRTPEQLAEQTGEDAPATVGPSPRVGAQVDEATQPEASSPEQRVRAFLLWHHQQPGACRAPYGPCSCTSLPALDALLARAEAAEARVKKLEAALNQIVVVAEHAILDAGTAYASTQPYYDIRSIAALAAVSDAPPKEQTYNCPCGYPGAEECHGCPRGCRRRPAGVTGWDHIDKHRRVSDAPPKEKT